LDIIDAITVLMNYGLITKIPPATILSSNPALAQFANMSFGAGAGAGANFSGLTSILAASMAASIGMQNALTSGSSTGVSNGMMGGPGGMMNPSYDFDNGMMHGGQPIMHQQLQQQQPLSHHHQQQQHHVSGNPYQGHQQRKVNKR
jgi:hypothetical protein